MSNIRQVNQEVLRFNDSVFLIDETGANVGMMPASDALKLAYSKDLDLVGVALNAEQQLVCKIMDYNKHQYNLKKAKSTSANKKSGSSAVQFSCRIDEHDYEVKINNAVKLLAKGNSVSLVLRCSAREMRIIDTTALKVIQRAVQDLSKVSRVESQPKIEGRIVKAVLSPTKTFS